MTPVFISIHGVRCLVLLWARDEYRVQRADTGVTLATAPRRLQAIAKAAVLLHTPRSRA